MANIDADRGKRCQLDVDKHMEDCKEPRFVEASERHEYSRAGKIPLNGQLSEDLRRDTRVRRSLRGRKVKKKW